MAYPEMCVEFEQKKLDKEKEKRTTKSKRECVVAPL